MEKEYEVFKSFVFNHLNDDVNGLRLRYHNNEPHYKGFSAIDQIDCRTRCRHKLSRFLLNEDFIFPTVLSSEQCSNEDVAEYHKSLLTSETSLCDMTAGLGIDFFTMSRGLKRAVGLEFMKGHSDALIHNSEIFGSDNIRIENVDSIQYLKSSPEHFDVIFADPARRGNHNQRTMAFQDCNPDIIPNLDLILSHTSRLIIKASPMLDIKEVAHNLPCLDVIHIVAVNGECKEVLAECRKESSSPSGIVCVNLSNNDVNRSLHIPFYESSVNPDRFFEGEYSGYLYEPSAEIMKAAPWKWLTMKYPGVVKISPNTHLFFSDKLHKDFPGRIIAIEKTLGKPELKHLKGECFNVVCRNNYERPEEIAKRYKLKGSRNRFLYCFKDNHNNPVKLSGERV